MKRREFLKLANTAGAAALFSGNNMISERTSPQMRTGQLNDIKNILVLFVDQQRFDCLIIPLLILQRCFVYLACSCLAEFPAQIHHLPLSRR